MLRHLNYAFNLYVKPEHSILHRRLNKTKVIRIFDQTQARIINSADYKEFDLTSNLIQLF